MGRHESLFRRENVITNRIQGFINAQKEVFIPLLKPTTFLRAVWHELGHPIGYDLSFLNQEVLTPDQVKKTSIRIPFKSRLKLIRQLMFNNRTQLGFNPSLMPIAMEILQIFTKGNFSAEDYTFYLDYPYDELLEMIRLDDSINTVRFNESGDLEGVSSIEGRNTELPATTVEVGCTNILANSLGPFIGYEFGPLNFTNSHSRAYNFVRRAYLTEGCILPSSKDMEESAI